MKVTISQALMFVMAVFIVPGVAHADQFSVTVSDNGGTTNWEIEDLDAFEQVVLLTATTWSEEPIRFSGPLVRDVLKASGITNPSSILRATAYNGYHVDIPVAEFQEHDVVLASRANGELIPLEDRGPYRFVYDFSKVGAKKDSYWIWMLEKMVVLSE